MTKKYIFTDLDFTLVPPGRPIPDSAKKAIRELLANGHEVFICTGRNHFAGEECVDVEHSGGIYSVGGEIYVNNEFVNGFYFTDEDRKTIISIADKYDLCVSIVTANDVFANGWAFEHKQSEPYYADHFFHLARYDGKPSAKMNFHSLPKQEKELQLAINELSEHGYNHAYKFVKTAVEITPGNVSKGSAIKWLGENGYLKLEDTIGIGDSFNDLEMLKDCAYSIAMGNGDKEIFDYVDMVTDHIDNDGFYKAFKNLGLID